MSADVSIVIVTYNSREVLSDCLLTLPRGSEYELIVIDNQSHDDSAALARALRSDATVIENDSNAGFAAAVNAAARHAIGRYILLINPDAAVDKSALDGMIDTADKDPQIAVLSPLVNDRADTFATVAAGYFPTLWRMFTHASGLSRLGHLASPLRGHYLLHKQMQGHQRLDVDWVSGGCMLIHKEVWETLGGLSERWFMYAEDIEFCLRVRQAGYSVVVDSSQTALHEIGGSSSNVDGRVGTLWLINLYDLYRWKLASSRISSWLWKQVVVGGFELRAAVTRSRGDKGASHRFQRYARALARESSSISRNVSTSGKGAVT